MARSLAASELNVQRVGRMVSEGEMDDLMEERRSVNSRDCWFVGWSGWGGTSAVEAGFLACRCSNAAD